MSRPKHELADIIERFGGAFIEQYHPNAYQLRVLGALSVCRTAALGGHTYRCDHCNREHIAYNSCRNRHCPKCQGAKQAFWVEDRINNAYPVKHYHIVFTLPHELNAICQLDSRWFYNHLFATVWKVLRTFGYSHFGVQSGAICLLHTWGGSLIFHPHLHCIVPALGYSLRGCLKKIGKGGKFLYPVKQLSLNFRNNFMAGIKKHLNKQLLLASWQSTIDSAWAKPWNVNCKPSLGKPEKVVKYLGQYTHRVAISNQSIVDVDDQDVRFIRKDYCDQEQMKTTCLTGVEFLRRFCQHILPAGFVKIRHYGIYSTRFRNTLLKHPDKIVVKPLETTIQRIKRVLGIEVCRCPACKKGRLIPVAILPRIRSPGFVKTAMAKWMKY